MGISFTLLTIKTEKKKLKPQGGEQKELTHESVL